MARVFVVQNQTRWDEAAGRFVPRYPTVASAESFGRLVFALDSRATPFRPDESIARLEDVLRDFDSDEDYLLLIGNPNFIWWAGAIAARNGTGRVRTLQWSSKEGRYVVVDSSIDLR